MTNSIRAWITPDTSPEHLAEHQIKRYNDDIVLVYRNGQLTSITGYRTRVIQLPQQINDVDDNVLSEIFPISTMKAHLQLNGAFNLSNDEWPRLKEKILKRNTGLKGIIQLLEEAQMKHAQLSGYEAFAYDALWTITRMFHRSKQQIRQDVFEALRSARQTAASARVTENKTDAIEQLFQVLEMSSYFRAVDRARDPSFIYAQQIAEKAIEEHHEPKPPRAEEDIIRGDAHEFGDWEADGTYFGNREWKNHAIRMTDPQSKRELFIFMAHRKGKGKRGNTKDAAGADLIYASRESKSFVLVQYKILKLDSDERHIGGKVEEKLHLHGKDYQQLLELVALCDDIQQCSHICGRDPDKRYLPSHEIRLANCPAFYKLVGHNHDLLPSRDFIEGNYVQACYIRSLMDEKSQKTLDFPNDIQRTMNHSEFTALTGGGYLGFRAEVYEQVLQHVHKALPSGIIMLALEEKVTA